MSSDISPKADSPAVGVPLWLVADTFGITPRQVYRLEKRGLLDSWYEGAARVYGLDQVRRLARERRRQAKEDTRMVPPSEAAMRVLEHGMAPDLCRSLVRYGAVRPERAFWSYIKSAGISGREATNAEYVLMGDLASFALQSQGAR